MSAEMITALTALAVALLSAGTAVYSTRTAARLQRELSARQEATDAASERLAAYTAYCTAVRLHILACWELAQTLTPTNRDPGRCDARYAAYEECWNRVAEAQALARVSAASAGDEPIAENLSVVIRCAALLGDMVAAWYHELRKQDWQSGGRRTNRLDAAYNASLHAVDTLEDEMVRVAARRRAPAEN